MDVMIDIETLATRNDAAIIQIGAVAFDPESDTLGASMLVSVDKEFYEGNTQFYVDERTKAWWAKQSPEARKSLDMNKVSTIHLAMDRLTEFFEQIEFKKSGNPGKGVVWARPPQFDLSILRHAASKAYGNDTEVPWHYRQENCMRTAMRSTGHHINWDDLGERAEDLVHHRADHDAMRQAMVVQEMYKRMRL